MYAVCMHMCLACPDSNNVMTVSSSVYLLKESPKMMFTLQIS